MLPQNNTSMVLQLANNFRFKVDNVTESKGAMSQQSLVFRSTTNQSDVSNIWDNITEENVANITLLKNGAPSDTFTGYTTIMSATKTFDPQGISIMVQLLRPPSSSVVETSESQ